MPKSNEEATADDFVHPVPCPFTFQCTMVTETTPAGAQRRLVQLDLHHLTGKTTVFMLPEEATANAALLERVASATRMAGPIVSSSPWPRRAE